jgi:hypothetical protein
MIVYSGLRLDLGSAMGARDPALGSEKTDDFSAESRTIRRLDACNQRMILVSRVRTLKPCSLSRTALSLPADWKPDACR